MSGAPEGGSHPPETASGERDARLAAQPRALVRLSAAVARGEAERVERAMGEALEAAEPLAVEEALLQSHLFLGYPAALNALAVWRRVSGRRAPAASKHDPGLWRERGEGILARVYGSQVDALRATVRHLHPDMETWMVSEGYGRVLGRPGLALSERELCVLAILAVSGATTQLYSHLRGAMAVGVEPGVVAQALREALAFAEAATAEAALRTWSDLRARRATPLAEGAVCEPPARGGGA